VESPAGRHPVVELLQESRFTVQLACARLHDSGNLGIEQDFRKPAVMCSFCLQTGRAGRLALVVVQHCGTYANHRSQHCLRELIRS
jgi:hypothetical protein